VTDFGLAKVFNRIDRHDGHGRDRGTPSYMAPEQASGRRAEIGPATDVYSLGAILLRIADQFAAVSRREPVGHADGRPQQRSVDAADAQSAHPARAGTDLPEVFGQRPSERYESASALADELDRFARGEALSVRPPTVMQRFWSWTRRQPALASRLGALGIFYIVETVNYCYEIVTPQFHIGVSLVIALWIVASIICQQLLETRRWSFSARYIWERSTPWPC